MKLTKDNVNVIVKNIYNISGCKSQKEFAYKTMQTESSICHYIRESRTPNLNHLIEILEKMGYHLEVIKDD